MGRRYFFPQQPIPNTRLHQPRMRWVPGTLFQRINRPEHEDKGLAPCCVETENTRKYSYAVRNMRFTYYTLGRDSSFVVRWPEMSPLSIHPMTDEWLCSEGKSQVFGENPFSLPLCSPQIPQGVVADWTLGISTTLPWTMLCVGTPLRGAVWVLCAHLCHYSGLWITDLSVAWGNVYRVSIFISTYEAVRICGCFV